MRILLRLFAPFIPFATEEAWSWSEPGSVHTAAWPAVSELGSAGEGGDELLRLSSAALTSIRGAKTAAKASQKTPVASAEIAAPEAEVALLRGAADDLRAVGRIGELRFAVAEALEVRDIVLAEQA